MTLHIITLGIIWLILEFIRYDEIGEQVINLVLNDFPVIGIITDYGVILDTYERIIDLIILRLILSLGYLHLCWLFQPSLYPYEKSKIQYNLFLLVLIIWLGRYLNHYFIIPFVWLNDLDYANQIRIIDKNRLLDLEADLWSDLWSSDNKSLQFWYSMQLNFVMSSHCIFRYQMLIGSNLIIIENGNNNIVNQIEDRVFKNVYQFGQLFIMRVVMKLYSSCILDELMVISLMLLFMLLIKLVHMIESFRNWIDVEMINDK